MRIRTVTAAMLMHGILFFGGQALPCSFAPLIDFRDEATWGGANYDPSFTATDNGVELTLTAYPPPAKLWWDDRDGIGIRLDYENDEIEGNERLLVEFTDVVSLSAIYLADLYVELDYIETGKYQLNDGVWQAWEEFGASSVLGTGSNGEHVIQFDEAVQVTALRFKAPGRINGENHEYALLGLDASLVPGDVSFGEAQAPVPEPSAALLFLAGSLIVARAARRHTAPEGNQRDSDQ